MHNKQYLTSITFVASIILILNFISMPKEFYWGDAQAIKIEAISLANTGKFGISYNDSSIISATLKNKHQYFIENDNNERYYNRWGLFNTLLFAFPELFNPFDAIKINSNTVLYHNYMNIIISVIIGIYLFKLARRYTTSNLTCVIYIMFVLYGTFIWSYMRSQTYEIFQLLFFTIFFYYFSLCLNQISLIKRLQLNINYILYNLFFIFLILSKSFYFFLYPIAMIVIIGSMNYRKGSAIKNIIELNNLLLLIMPLVFSLIIYFSISYVVNGFLFFGYAHNMPFSGETSWSLGFYKERLYDYFFSANRSLFIHFIPIVFAIFYYKNFFDNHRWESVMLLLSFLIATLILGALYTVGEWCYGPRFYVFLLPVFCLPAIYFIDSLKQFSFKIKPILFAFLFIFSFAYMCHLQISFNSRPFHARYTMEAILNEYYAHETYSPVNQDKFDAALAYLNERNLAIISKDLNSFLNKNKDFIYSDAFFKQTDNRILIKRRLKQFLNEKLPVNYY